MRGPHNVKLVVDVALFQDAAVLMTRYQAPAAYDGQAGLFLPNDLLDDREDPADAARRVLRDQLGISDVPVELTFAESFTGRDRTWHLALHYVVKCDDAPRLDVSGHLAGPRWFAVGELPPRSDVAHGGWALRTIERILQG